MDSSDRIEQIYLSHILAQIHNNLDFLVSQHQISRPGASLIRSKLPASPLSLPPPPPPPSDALSPSSNIIRSAPQFPRPINSSATNPVSDNPFPQNPPSLTPSPSIVPSSIPPIATSNTNNHPSAGRPANPPPPPPPVKRAKALWSYHGSAPDDLSFSKGDIIKILHEENQDWWRGEVVGKDSQPGLFPSNHVERLPDAPSAPSIDERSYGPPAHYPNEQQRYSHPAPPQQQQPQPQPQQQQQPGWQPTPYVQPPYHPNDQKPQYPIPPAQDQVQSAAPPNQSTSQPPKKKPFQGRLGQAFVGGAGFGAGSAVAGHVVNAIL